MTEVSTTLFWGLIEFLILLIVVLIGIAVMGFLRKRKDKQAAQELIAYLKANNGARSKLLKSKFKENYGYEGDDLKKTVRDLSKKELLFYQHLLNTYLKRSTQHLTKIYIPLEEMIAPYLELDVSKGGGAGEEADNSELERLQKENEELTEELRVTMDTMGRMLEEYSGMFSAPPVGDDPAPAAPDTTATETSAEVELDEEVETDDMLEIGGSPVNDDELVELPDEPATSDSVIPEDILDAADLDNLDLDADLTDDIDPTLLEDK